MHPRRRRMQRAGKAWRRCIAGRSCCEAAPPPGAVGEALPACANLPCGQGPAGYWLLRKRNGSIMANARICPLAWPAQNIARRMVWRFAWRCRMSKPFSKDRSAEEGVRQGEGAATNSKRNLRAPQPLSPRLATRRCARAPVGLDAALQPR